MRRLGGRYFVILVSLLVLSACAEAADDPTTTAAADPTETTQATETTQPATETTQPATETTQPPEAERITLNAASSGTPGLGSLAHLLLWEELGRNGIDVNEIYVGSNEAAVQALVRGDVDFGFQISPAATASAVVEGIPLRIASGWVGSEFVLGGTTDIQTVEDLSGKRLGIHNEVGLSATLTQALVEEFGLEDVELLVVPNSPARVEAIAQGQLDAATIDVENGVALEKLNPEEFHIILEFTELVGPIENGGFTATSDFYEANPELVQTIVTTWVEVVRRMYDDPDWAAEQSIRYFGINYADTVDDLRDLTREYIARGLWDPDGGLTQESAQDTIQFHIDFGELSEDALNMVDEIYEFSFIESVLDELGPYEG